MGKAGRPSKFTEDRKKRIIEATRVGCTRVIAAAYAGVPIRSMQAWITRGNRESGTDYSRFVGDLELADAQCAIKALALIQNAALNQGHWQAAAWLLERRHGYRREMSLAVSIEADSEILTVEELRQEIEAADKVILPMLGGPVIDLDE